MKIKKRTANFARAVISKQTVSTWRKLQKWRRKVFKWKWSIWSGENYLGLCFFDKETLSGFTAHIWSQTSDHNCCSDWIFVLAPDGAFYDVEHPPSMSKWVNMCNTVHMHPVYVIGMKYKVNNRKKRVCVCVWMRSTCTMCGRSDGGITCESSCSLREGGGGGRAEGCRERGCIGGCRFILSSLHSFTFFYTSGGKGVSRRSFACMKPSHSFMEWASTAHGQNGDLDIFIVDRYISNINEKDQRVTFCIYDWKMSLGI